MNKSLLYKLVWSTHTHQVDDTSIFNLSVSVYYLLAVTYTYMIAHLIVSFCSHGPTHVRLMTSSNRPKGCTRRWSASERSEVLVAMVIIVSAYWAYSIACQILFSSS